ncbi:hypothetical protein [Vulgatibacter incomptus]|uniref:Uncharacterized protein n=1 Tax=Vulgatibacter incomptus TaxID=1391653 RepID=A0A0K1PBM7_9BACT|nr:hypothetical protein [Vulgatibacter incomptus]AKU90930.1 hypothetical protein AKJ08_1317 [Vulgatibacter incomptus]
MDPSQIARASSRHWRIDWDGGPHSSWELMHASAAARALRQSDWPEHASRIAWRSSLQGLRHDASSSAID